MNIQFWGVRGSIPVPGPDTVTYGGNTSCISSEIGDEILVLDSGTGIRNLGNYLLAQRRALKVHLFLSHVHWDHIQGFPFFGPAYVKGNKIHIYGAENADMNLSSILAGQMQGPSFPISIDTMGADIFFHDLKEGEVIKIKSGNRYAAIIFNKKLNHPNGVLGYRIEDKLSGSVLTYATDTEHYENRLDRNLLTLCREADALIYDSMYTTEEYYGNNGKMSHKTWGHSTWEKGLEIAEAGNVKRLLLFHHDPAHSDEFMDRLEKTVKNTFKRLDKKIRVKVVICKEGMILKL